MILQNKHLNLILVFVSLLSSCATVDKFNAQIDIKKSVNDLKFDVDYIKKKLVKLHPDLYHYIPENEFNLKFDSLSNSLKDSMTSKDFYFKLSPIIASIKQGHTQTYPLTKKLNRKESKMVQKVGISPLVRFEYELFNNELYIIKNNSNDTTIKPGTKIISINGENPIGILTKYEKTFTSDGNNYTFVPKRLAKGFPRYFYYDYGIVDSIQCKLSFNDSIRDLTLKQNSIRTMPKITKSKNEIAQDKKISKNLNKIKKLQGYDKFKRKYSKQLIFQDKDSTIAILKIADFTKGNYKKFYKNSFKLLDSLKTKTLIIDLRDNGGGRLNEVSILFKYLSDSSFHFIEKAEVTSKTSLWHDAYFSNKPVWKQAIQTVLIPSIVLKNMITYFATIKGKDNKYRIALFDSWKKHPKSNQFKGKVYVLINGGSFSASSLLSSNLKGSKRAIFVGEETGGADNGCVAGIMPTRVLPKSKLKVNFGLLLCKSPYIAEIDGRGIFPNIEIKPTLIDVVNNIDPEMQWILKDIESKENRLK